MNNIDGLMEKRRNSIAMELCLFAKFVQASVYY